MAGSLSRLLTEFRDITLRADPCCWDEVTELTQHLENSGGKVFRTPSDNAPLMFGLRSYLRVAPRVSRPMAGGPRKREMVELCRDE
jgi:hypothetical protein